MLQRIEALNYRSLRYVSQELRPFQVLVGPNASGKSTFLDVVALLSDFVRHGLSDALLFGSELGRGRASRLDELIFKLRQTLQNWFSSNENRFRLKKD